MKAELQTEEVLAMYEVRGIQEEMPMYCSGKEKSVRR